MVVARHASGEEQQSREPALARRLAQAQVDAPTGHPSRELRRRRLRVPRLTGPGRGVSTGGDAPAHLGHEPTDTGQGHSRAAGDRRHAGRTVGRVPSIASGRRDGGEPAGRCARAA